MKRIFVFTALALVFSLAGCNTADGNTVTTVNSAVGGNDSGTNAGITDYISVETTAVYTETQVNTALCSVPTSATQPQKTEPNTVQPSFSAQYIRTNISDSDAFKPSTVIIKSSKELDEYYSKNKDTFDLSEFKTKCEKYDDGFFNEHTLVLIVQQEPSGSYRHTVKNVEKDASGYFINIGVSRPEIYTCDMAQWHIIVELNDTEIESVTPLFEE